MHQDKRLSTFQRSNLPCIVHRRLFLKIPMHCLIAIGPMTMTIVMVPMAPPPHLHWAITLHKLRVESTAYSHQVVYLPLT